MGLNVIPGFVDVLDIGVYSLCAEEDFQRADEVNVDFSQGLSNKNRQPVMPDLIRHPGVVPTKVGNRLKYWIPVFTGNPGFRLSPE